MPRPQKPFTTPRRGDARTFQLTINPASGLPQRICQDWRRKSFQDLPDALARYRNPRTKSAAEAGAFALIEYLKKQIAQGNSGHVHTEEITVGAWLEKFTAMETSPRSARNIARNRPYSPDTIENYKCFYEGHVKEDPITLLKMSEIEEQDVLEFSNRIAMRKKKNGVPLGGTRTFAGIIIFVRMAFKEYQKTHHRWFNPCQSIDPPQIKLRQRDALPEEDVIKLFMPGVLETTMDVAVCAAMFLSGLRRSEIFALKPECLDWETPKITVKNAWQLFNKKNRILGPTKGKKVRTAPFDPILQEAIKKLWAENGQHEFVFCWKNGKIPGSSWIERRFEKWLTRANIKVSGRNIVPHSARHSLASLLEERGVSLRYIQELLGHSDLKTTKIYLHSTEATIRKIGEQITAAMGISQPVTAGL